MASPSRASRSSGSAARASWPRAATPRRSRRSSARRAVAWALGCIGGDDAVKILRRMVATEESKFAAGMALLAIVRTKHPDAFDILSKEVGRESHRDLLRQHIFDG